MWKKSESSPGVGNLDLAITNTVFATVNVGGVTDDAITYLNTPSLLFLTYHWLVLKNDGVPCSSNYFEADLTILEISGLSCLTMLFCCFFSVSQKKDNAFLLVKHDKLNRKLRC
jgi:hypothetical protein